MRIGTSRAFLLLLYAAQVGQAFLPAPQRTGLEACPYLCWTRYTDWRNALAPGQQISCPGQFLGSLLLAEAAEREQQVRILRPCLDPSFGALDPRVVMRDTIPATTLMIGGMELVLASFLLSVLRLREGG